jgi:hypothetical protein
MTKHLAVSCEAMWNAPDEQRSVVAAPTDVAKVDGRAGRRAGRVRHWRYSPLVRQPGEYPKASQPRQPGDGES